MLKERGQPGGARTSSDAKEEKRSRSARFKNAKEEKRNKSARFKKSSEEIGAKGLQKVLNTADTDNKYCHTELMVPRSSGPPE